MQDTLDRVAVPAAPERSLEQRLEALKRANEVRSYRAELKRGLRDRVESPLEVLRSVVPEVETMKVFDLLIAIPKFGRVKVNRLLGRARIAPSKTIGGLSDRQRRDLIVMVAPYARGIRPRSLL